jgi:dephospho-CoA kinase
MISGNHNSLGPNLHRSLSGLIHRSTTDNLQKMLIVGLTGGIATGKSTVSKILQSSPHSLAIIDADILAREAVEPGTRAFNRILNTFGADLALRNPDSGAIIGLDRTALGKRVFSGDEAARQRLNKIVHPAVRWLMFKRVLWEWLIMRKPVVVLDIPLLFEGGLDRFCGITVVVSTERELQFERLLARDSRLSEDSARGRIASQWDINEKKKLADVVIENDSTKEDLKIRVAEVVNKHFSRSRLWTWMLCIPPVGLTFAFVIFLRRTFQRRKKTE